MNEFLKKRFQKNKVISEAEFLKSEKAEIELEQIFSKEHDKENPTKPTGK